MNSQLYIRKAVLQLKRGEIEKAVENIKLAIEADDDFVSVVQAHCILGEYYFVTQQYPLSIQHLEYILEVQEEIETQYDDLLNDEILTAYTLLEIIEKFKL